VDRGISTFVVGCHYGVGKSMLCFKKNDGKNRRSTRANTLLSASISGINVPFLRKMEKALCVWPKNEGDVVLGLNKMYKDKEEK